MSVPLPCRLVADKAAPPLHRRAISPEAPPPPLTPPRLETLPLRPAPTAVQRAQFAPTSAFPARDRCAPLGAPPAGRVARLPGAHARALPVPTNIRSDCSALAFAPTPSRR